MQNQPSNQNQEWTPPQNFIDRLLVVIDPALLPRMTPDDALLRRAIWLAQGVGADIELFCVSDDESPFNRLLKSRQAQAQERIETADSVATKLAELAVTVAASGGLTVQHDARWAKDEAATIVQKAAESRADMVLKASERCAYLVGLLDHPDWTLIRQTPAHVWFVADNSRAPQHLLATVGTNDREQEEVASENDQQVYELASLLGRAHLVSSSLLQIKGENPNPARDAIPALAEAVDADLILMGATNLTRLDRLLRPVTEEPVLARTKCDVVFLRSADLSEPPLPAGPTVQGLPSVDVERALTDPEIVFNHSPDRLAAEDRLSVEMRQRLLRVWEQDLKAALIAEDDNDPKGDSTSQLLPAVQRARASLESADQQSKHSHG